jgi:predicted dehydrogenase
MRIAIVGAGRMGGHHARVIARSGRASVNVVVDVDPMRAELLASSVSARASSRLEEAFDADAAIVATPPASHLPIALALFDAGVPLLVEKPLSDRLEEATTIVRASGASGVPMTTGFVERFNPVVQTAMRLMEDSGPAVHVVGLRHSPPDPIVDTDVVFDLLVHDIDLALRLLDGDWAGEAVGGVWHGTKPGIAEIADCTLVTDAGAVATLSASRMGQRKVRTIELATERNQMELDLLRRTMTVYRHVRHEVDDGSAYRAETVMDIPFVHDAGEPLAQQLDHFTALARGEVDPELERRGLLAPHRVATLVRAQALGTVPVVADAVRVA